MDTRLDFDCLAAAYHILAPPQRRLASEGPMLEAWCAGAAVVLDAGCGTGFHAGHLARRLGPASRLVGIDLAPAMVRAARERHQAPGLAFLVADIAAPPMAGIDRMLVVGNGANLLPDRGALHRALGAWYRTLRPGGRVLVHCQAPAPGDGPQTVTREGAYAGRSLSVTKTLCREGAGVRIGITIAHAGERQNESGWLLGLGLDEVVSAAASVGLAAGRAWRSPGSEQQAELYRFAVELQRP